MGHSSPEVMRWLRPQLDVKLGDGIDSVDTVQGCYGCLNWYPARCYEILRAVFHGDDPHISLLACVAELVFEF